MSHLDYIPVELLNVILLELNCNEILISGIKVNYD